MTPSLVMTPLTLSRGARSWSGNFGRMIRKKQTLIRGEHDHASWEFPTKVECFAMPRIWWSQEDSLQTSIMRQLMMQVSTVSCALHNGELSIFIWLVRTISTSLWQQVNLRLCWAVQPRKMSSGNAPENNRKDSELDRRPQTTSPSLMDLWTTWIWQVRSYPHDMRAPQALSFTTVWG